MKNRLKNLLCITLSVLMLLSVLPLSGFEGITFEASASDLFTDGYYTYTVKGKNATITDVRKTISGDITVPSELGGYTVTEIGNNAFYNCSEITKLTVPGSVKKIGNRAFHDCYSITDIIIGEGTEYIGSQAFYYCGNLKNISLPSTITYIDASSSSFEGCHDLNNIIISENNSHYSADKYAIYNKEKDNLVLFYNQTITSFTIPSSTKTIGAYAFYRSDNLRSIIMPDSVTRVENDAFGMCSILKELHLSDNLTYIGRSAFSNIGFLLGAVEEIIIPEGVSNISYYIFNYSKIGQVTILNPDASISSYGSSTIPEDIVISGFKDSTAQQYAETYGNSFIPLCNNAETKYKHIDNNKDNICDQCSLSTILASDASENNISWSLDIFGTLTITGSGIMPEFQEDNIRWLKNKYFIRKVVLDPRFTSICSNAFKECANLSDVVLSENITSIGENAFRNCANLEQLNLPSVLTSIGSNAFSSSGIKEIEIPEKVTAIPNSMFHNCFFLEKVKLHNNIKSIGVDAFNSCWRLQDITLPSGLKSLLGYSFYGCVSLKSINIPKGIDTINGATFTGCTSLEEINLPDTVTYIGSYAFGGCDNLKSINLPQNLTTIGSEAFDGCKNLSEIFIPKNVSSMTGAFSNCPKLKISISQENNYYYANNNSIYTKDGSTLVYYGDYSSENFSVPENVTKIDYRAFAGNKKVKNVILPNGLTYIDSDAFINCIAIESIAIPSGVKSIFGETFRNCDSLRNLTLSEGLIYIDYYAFYECDSLTSVVLPASLTTIGSDAFNCDSLKKAVILNSETEINYNNFADCNIYGYKNSTAETYVKNDRYNNLTFITICPDSPNEYEHLDANQDMFCDYCSETMVIEEGNVTDTIKYAFTFDKILLITGTGEIPDYSTWDETNRPPWQHLSANIDTVIIGNGITTIGRAAFNEHEALKKAVLPESVTTIRENAFSECSYLSEINFSEGLTTIEYHAFSNCDSLTSVILPESLTVISSSFEYCDGITEVYIPALITNGVESFLRGINNLEKLTISENNTAYSADEKALFNKDKTKLLLFIAKSDKRYTIPASVTYINYSAFSNCTSLETVTIPESVKTIDQSAFSGCSALKSVTIPASVTDIASYAFENCTSLENINIPDTVTSIRYNAFNNCTALKSVIIPDSVTHIGSSAFENCQSLENINIPDSITSIDYNAFRNCSSLTNITIPDSVEEISGGAFEKCTKLSSVTLPENVNISNSAFDDTAIYNDKSNWENGVFYIGTYLISADNDLLTETVAIKPGTKNIASDALYFYNTALETIIIPDSVTGIGDSFAYSETKVFFRGTRAQWNAATEDTYGNDNYYLICSYSDDLIIEESFAYKIVNSGAVIVTAFTNTVPETLGGFPVIEIGEYAYNSQNLSELVFPASLKVIGEAAFTNNTLASIIFKGTPERIEKDAFKGCKTGYILIPGGKTEFSKIDIKDGNTVLSSDKVYSEYPFSNISVRYTLDIPEGYYCEFDDLYWEYGDYMIFRNKIEITRTFKDGTSDTILAENDISFVCPDTFEAQGVGTYTINGTYFGEPISFTINIIDKISPEADEPEIKDSTSEITWISENISVDGEIDEISHIGDYFVIKTRKDVEEYDYEYETYIKKDSSSEIQKLDIPEFSSPVYTELLSWQTKITEIDGKYVLSAIYSKGEVDLSEYREVLVSWITEDFNTFTKIIEQETEYWNQSFEFSFFKVKDTYIYTVDEFNNPKQDYEYTLAQGGSQLIYYTSEDLQTWTKRLSPALPDSVDYISINSNSPFNLSTGENGLYIDMYDYWGNGYSEGYEHYGLYYTDDFENYTLIDDNNISSNTWFWKGVSKNGKSAFVTLDYAVDSWVRSYPFTCTKVIVFDEKTKTFEVRYTDSAPSDNLNFFATPSYANIIRDVFGEEYNYWIEPDGTTKIYDLPYSLSERITDTILKGEDGPCLTNITFAAEKLYCTANGGQSYYTFSLPEEFTSKLENPWGYYLNNIGINVIDKDGDGENDSLMLYIDNNILSCDIDEFIDIIDDDAINHTWDEGTVTKEPTCNEPGEKTYYCICGEDKTEEIPSMNTEHNIVTHEGKAATCVEKGFDAYETCTKCSYTTYKETDYDRNNHINTENTPAVPPTEDSVGYTEGVYCNDCKTYISGHEEIPVQSGKIEIAVTETVKLSDNNVLAIDGQTVSDILKNATVGAVIVDKNGNEVSSDKPVCSGMTILLKDKNGNEIDSKTIIVPGDNDGDGNISSADARTALRASVGLDELNNWQSTASNLDAPEENDISSADARYILRASVGLEDMHSWLKTLN